MLPSGADCHWGDGRPRWVDQLPSHGGGAAPAVGDQSPLVRWSEAVAGPRVWRDVKDRGVGAAVPVLWVAAHQGPLFR